MLANSQTSIKEPVLIVGVGNMGGDLAALAGKLCGCDSLHINYDSNFSYPTSTKIKISTEGWINPSVSKLRSFAAKQLAELKEAIRNYRTLVVISNLAGRGGAAIAPLICELAKSNSCSIVSVATMPFAFEHNKIFSSGVALRRVRESSDSVIVVDNQAFLENNPESSQRECFTLTNKCIVDVVSHLVKTGNNSSELSLATTASSAHGIESALESSISSLYPQLLSSTAVSSTILHVIGGSAIPLSQLRDLVESTRGALSESGTSQVTIASLNSSGDSQVHLVTSVMSETKFDRYDPLAQIIPKENVLDWDDLETASDLPLSVFNLE